MSDLKPGPAADHTLVLESITPGSLPWFACLYAPAPQRTAFRALFSLRHEVGKSVRQVQEADIARIKLSWWREEIDRYRAEKPVHPVCLSLLDENGALLVDADRLLSLLEAAHRDLDSTIYPGSAELLAYCRLSGGNFLLLLAELLAGKNLVAGQQEEVLTIGSGIRLVEILRDLGQNVAFGQCLLPLDWLDEAGLTVADLASDRPQAKARELLARVGDLARQNMKPVADGDTESVLPAQPALSAYIAMHRRLLEKLERKGYQNISRGKGLFSTFEMMHVSWRAARRSARQG